VGAYKVGEPYEIDGAWYYPAEDYTYVEAGIASWYGRDFHGRRTANGERYDMNALTAAHRTLPMPSAVRVTNLENGRSVVLRVNDRGPFARGRVIDVSRRASKLLGFHGRGTAKVRVEILPDESRQLKLAALNSPAGRAQQVAVRASPRVEVKTEAVPEANGVVAETAASVASGAGGQTSVIARARVDPPVLPTGVEVLPVSPTGIYVQVGAFADFSNALRMRDRVRRIGSTQLSRFRMTGTEVYRVRIGPIATVEVADAVLARIFDAGVKEARIVVE
ncbi:MAG: septal ring lytic transglycosylase RlpA family protein, partial [Alphaproteobacteria bacterium]